MAKNRPEAQGTFDLATVEELALFFAEESWRRLRIPLLLRLVTLGQEKWSRQEEIDRVRSSPPRADANGVAYPFGDKNPLSFVFDPETRTLSCWERIVKKYGSTGYLALTGPEMAVALNRVSSRERDRGGADFAYDPIRDALSLRRSYLHPPADRDRFYGEIRRLVATAQKWMEGRYLKAAIPIAESRHPPEVATASKEGFAATLVLRHFSAAPSESNRFVERYVRAWDRPHGGRTPMLVSDRELQVDQILHAYIHFQGAENDAQGTAEVNATLRLLAPDGTAVFADLEVPLWRAEAPPTDHVQLGVNDMSITIDDENPTGTYRLEAEVCDTATDRCVKLAHPFVLRPR